MVGLGKIQYHSQSKPAESTQLFTCTQVRYSWTLIQFKFSLVARLESGVLAFFLQQTITNREHVDLRAHETAKRVLGRTDQGLAPHIETSVYDHRASGAPLEGGD